MTTANELVNKMIEISTDPEFIKLSAKAAEEMGVTASEWNKNKAFILMNFATEMIKRGI